MASYRFVGHTAIKEGVFELTRFGQAIDLDDKTAAEALADGVQILPIKDFDECGFTVKELDQWASPDSHVAAPEDFLAKKVKAWKRLHDIRAQSVHPVLAEHEA